MTLQKFIKENREELDSRIHGLRWMHVMGISKINDKERRKWILKDEDLYNWARQKGVKI